MVFTFKKLQIPEVILVTSKSFIDQRGFFLESFKDSYEHKLKNGVSLFKKELLKQ